MLHTSLLMRNASAPSHNSPLFTETSNLFISYHGQRGHNFLEAIWSKGINSRRTRILGRVKETENKKERQREREGGKKNVGHHNHIRNQFSAESEKSGLALC